jgi:hypothetical protein
LLSPSDEARGLRRHAASARTARIAGALYLLLALTAPFGILYVPAKVLIPGDPTTTARALRAAESLVRAGIASELFHQVVAICLVLALHRLLRRVDPYPAALMVILGALVSAPIVFTNVLNELAALAFARGEFLTSFDEAQRDSLAYLFLQLHGQGIEVVSVFWGLWLFPFAALVFRSRFVPRMLGVFLVLAGFASWRRPSPLS